MSTLSQQIVTDIKDAMKAKDAPRLTVLRSLKSAIQMATIEKHGADGELNEADTMGIVRKAIKQRQDSIASFKEAGRDELAANEAAEIVVLESYLPAAMTEDEIGKLVDEVIAEVGATSKKEMGAVMKQLQEKAAGRADNKLLSKLVMERLG
tara:strand:+ start:2483 stop:2938 length:456 start_codon:yes stop_codon:yes gene_type:complete